MPRRNPTIKYNAGLAIKYQRALESLIEAMHKGAARWIVAEYRRQAPKLAQDAPIRDLSDKIKEQSARWRTIFNKEAEQLAGWFIGQSGKVADQTAKAALVNSLPTVKFDPNRVYNQVQQALIKENVSLIKSIQSQYFSQVEQAVMRSASAGGDLKMLADELEHRYGVTRRRAEFIALDQNKKATMQMSVARQMGAGIEYGVWMHSHAGKEPRKSHEQAHGTVFKLSEGLYLEENGKNWAWIMPAWAIGCRCTYRPLIPGVDYPIGGVPEGYVPKAA